ncbi:MAG: hypothetical protein AAGG75_11100 [Bacteroidota bacterium]
MKKTISAVSLGVLTLFITLFCACQQKDTLIKSEEHMDAIEQHALTLIPAAATFERQGSEVISGTITVNCTSSECEGGNIGEKGHCQVKSDMNGKFECTCAGCKMTVSANLFDSEIDLVQQLSDANENYGDALQFVQQKHGEAVEGFNRISFDFQESFTSIVYEYELNNGDVETVLYVTVFDDDGVAGKTYEIDCTGGCGCREQYDFKSETASCSCEDCKMKVTTIDN